jgi:hypothetical protein
MFLTLIPSALAGMLNIGHVVIDGTKYKANASKHTTMSHEWMLRGEKQLDGEINALMRLAEILDAKEAMAKAIAAQEADIPALEQCE